MRLKRVAKVRELIANHRPQLISLALLGLGVGAGFAVIYLIGNKFGLVATGEYALVMQTAIFLATLGLFGLDQSAVRHFSKAVAERIPIALSSLLRFLGVGFGMLTTIAAVAVIGGDWLWQQLFAGVVAHDALLVLCLIMVARGGTLLVGGLLRSQQRFTTGIALATVLIPSAVALALATGLANSVREALWAAGFGSLMAVMIGLCTLSSHVAVGRSSVHIPIRTVLASSLPLWGVGLAQAFNDWYGLSMSARMLGAAEAGLFRVGVQVAAPMQMVSGALFAVYAAQISAAFHAGDRTKAAELARSALWLSSGIVVPMALVILVTGEFLLAQIGPEFADGYPVTAVLVIGQLAFTLTGPCGLLLAMSGNERINFLISGLGTLAVFIIVPLVLAEGGLLAMAVSLSAVMVARNVAAYFVVHRRVGIRIWSGTAVPLRAPD